MTDLISDHNINTRPCAGQKHTGLLIESRNRELSQIKMRTTESESNWIDTEPKPTPCFDVMNKGRITELKKQYTVLYLVAIEVSKKSILAVQIRSYPHCKFTVGFASYIYSVTDLHRLTLHTWERHREWVGSKWPNEYRQSVSYNATIFVTTLKELQLFKGVVLCHLHY